MARPLLDQLCQFFLYLIHLLVVQNLREVLYALPDAKRRRSGCVTYPEIIGKQLAGLG